MKNLTMGNIAKFGIGIGIDQNENIWGQTVIEAKT